MQKNWKEELLPYFGGVIKNVLEQIDENAPLEEIRVRAGQPLQLIFGQTDRVIYAPGGKPAASMEDCEHLLKRMCEQSMYAWEEEMRSGFLTLAGGYRVGFCGKTVLSEGRIQRITDITAMNIRIARAVVGVANPLFRFLPANEKTPSVLIFSPPGCGKTTLLRDAARQLSNGTEALRGKKVCIIDERMELSGAVRGLPQFDMGIRTDVLSGCPKSEAIGIAIRTLAPEVVITDELGKDNEADAIEDALRCGVAVWTSAHAGSLQELRERNFFGRLLKQKKFDWLVRLGRSRGPGTIEQIWNARMEMVRGTQTC